VGKPKYWGEQKVVKSDKCICISQLLWGRMPVPRPTKVYAYACGTEAQDRDCNTGASILGLGVMTTRFWGGRF